MRTSDAGSMLMIQTTTTVAFHVIFVCIFKCKSMMKVRLNSSNRKKTEHTNDTNILSYKVVIFLIYKMYMYNIDKFIICYILICSIQYRSLYSAPCWPGACIPPLGGVCHIHRSERRGGRGGREGGVWWGLGHFHRHCGL